jgi:galactose oxidase
MLVLSRRTTATLNHFVVFAGGGLCDCAANHWDFEILTPPYLYNTDGTLATRPTIQSSPTSARAGNSIKVVLNSSNSHTFALIKTSAVTHSVNNDQRRIPLVVTKRDRSTFTVRIPSNTNVTLLGDYFLFAMNGNGVPSIGASLRIVLA